MGVAGGGRGGGGGASARRSCTAVAAATSARHNWDVRPRTSMCSVAHSCVPCESTRSSSWSSWLANWGPVEAHTQTRAGVRGCHQGTRHSCRGPTMPMMPPASAASVARHATACKVAQRLHQPTNSPMTRSTSGTRRSSCSPSCCATQPATTIFSSPMRARLRLAWAVHRTQQ